MNIISCFRGALQAALCLSVLSSCSGALTGSSYEVRTPLSSTGIRLEGLGVELDPHFISQNVTRNDGATLEDWRDIVVRRVKMMDVQRFRVMLLPHWWEPVNDNQDSQVADMDRFTFDSAEMRSVCAVLDLAQETDASVTLVLWGCPACCSFVDESVPSHGQRHFLCDRSGTNWVTAPGDNEEFAENFSVVVKHLIEDKGYTCIKEVTPFNEPDGNVCEPDQYIQIVKALDRRFRRDGIRDKVRFNLSDNTDCRRFFLKECADNLADYADMFNSHTYMCGYESPNSYALGWEKDNIDVVRKTGKHHFVGEFGSNLCQGASRQKDINWYKRGVLITRNCLNFLNAGAVGASYWSLIDQYYNKGASYEEMQQLGLWRYKKCAYQGADAEGFEEDYQPRPNYYAYSLLTRFVRRGDEVFPLDLRNEYAAGTAFRSEDGRWTYVFANGSEDDAEFNLFNVNDVNLGDCDVYRYTEAGLPDDDSMISPCGVLRSSGKSYKVSVPAQSVLLLEQKYSE